MRYGAFSLDQRFVKEYPDLVKLLMGKCIITRCEFMYHSGMLDYVAICDDFRDIAQGEQIPSYRILFPGIEFSENEE